MINPKVFEENEMCVKCGGEFNNHFNLCADCKNTDNSVEVNVKQIKYKAVGYRDGDMNNQHIVIVTVKNTALGTIKLIVPYNSQIANRVKYYVDNEIRDFLEDGLSQDQLINIENFNKNVINGEVYLVLKGLLPTNEDFENNSEEKEEESTSINDDENKKLNSSNVQYEESLQKVQNTNPTFKEYIAFSLIFGYFIGSILIGVDQYQNLGELSTNYIVFQYVSLVTSIFCTLKFQNSPTIIGDTLATLGGGISMMIILQAILFYLLGDVIAENISTIKIIILMILAMIIVRIVFKSLTRRV